MKTRLPSGPAGVFTLSIITFKPSFERWGCTHGPNFLHWFSTPRNKSIASGLIRPLNGIDQPGKCARSARVVLPFLVPPRSGGSFMESPQTVSFSKVRDDEIQDIEKRREKVNLPTEVEDNLVGLSLSGGGVRSACFSTG